MFLNSETLKFVVFRVFDNGKAFKTTNSIMEGRCRGLERYGSVRNDLRSVPAVLLVPVNREHVICENFTELELSRTRWLYLLYVNLFSLEVGSSKSCSGLNGAKLADRLSE